MRVICSNCEANYELDAQAIPEEGRELQCSDCWYVWLQPFPRQREGLAHCEAPSGFVEEQENKEETSFKVPSEQLDPEALSLLHDEVDREMAARSVEQREDIGVKDGAETISYHEVSSKIFNEHSEFVEDEKALPNAVAIGTTLAGIAKRDHGDPVDEDFHDHESREDQSVHSGGGIVMALLWLCAITMLVGALGIFLYTRTDTIVGVLPYSSDLMETYVQSIDALLTTVQGWSGPG